jgi:N-acetylglucosaminyldiphosphoundecaprenol N-acetyl-beta-D-mannosaminyltransferase
MRTVALAVPDSRPDEIRASNEEKLTMAPATAFASERQQELGRGDELLAHEKTTADSPVLDADATRVRIFPKIAPDFSRNVHCLLGLPCDAMTIERAVAHMAASAAEGRRCHAATPNVNFLRLVRSDPEFRDAVLASDLCLIDGAPLFWIARALGLPIPERVAGSDCFEALRAAGTRRLGVYFFGGVEENCRKAGEALQSEKAGLYLAGACAPGFGAVEEMSRPEFIDRINAARPDLLVLSIGARKGLVWLARNESHLAIPVLCNLGSTINFVAGTVRRAPRALQRMGLEWLWRIKEEPTLWTRYAADLGVLLDAFLTQALPALFGRLRRPPDAIDFASARVRHTRWGDYEILTFSGAFGEANLDLVRARLAEATKHSADLFIALENVSSLDAGFLGLILVAYGHQRRIQRGFSLFAPNRALRAYLRRRGCAHLLTENAHGARRFATTDASSSTRSRPAVGVLRFASAVGRMA